jgi:hypothetical protein
MKFKEKTKALDFVRDRILAADNFQKPIFNSFVEYYKLYRGVRDGRKQNYKGAANLFVPYIYSTIEKAYPKMIVSKPRLNVYPREGGDIPGAKVNEKLLDYQWYTLNMKQKLKEWVKQGIMYGVSPIKVTWEFNEARGIDDQRIENIPIFDFLIDPGATNFSNASYCVHRTWKTKQELKSDKGYEFPIDMEEQTRKLTEYEQSIDAVKNRSRDLTSTNKLIKIDEFWGYFDPEKNGEENIYIITVANDDYVLKVQKNPYKHGKYPFVLFNDIVIPNELWSMGEIEMLVSLQYELNDIRNQRMDNVTQILRNMPMVDRSAGVKDYEIRNWQNGEVLYTNGQPDTRVSFARPPDVTASSYNEETLVKGDIQYASSVSDMTTFVGAKNSRSMSQDTATGATIQQEESNAIFKSKLDNLEDSLTELGQLMISNNQQFLTDDRVIRIIGEDGKQELFSIRPDDVRGNYDLIVEAGATQAMNKQIKRVEAVQLNNQLMPFVQMGVIDPKWAVTQLLDAYEIKGADNAFKQPDMAQMMAGEQELPNAGQEQPKAPNLTPEQMMAQQAAQKLGINLPPQALPQPK